MKTVMEFMESLDTKAKTIFLNIDTKKGYNPFTKGGQLRKDTNKYFVVYTDNDMYGNHLAYVKKVASKKALEEMGFCANHNGKMSGIYSFSTSPLMNSRCLARSKNARTICAYCYSIAMQEQYNDLQNKLIRNTKKWAFETIDNRDMPVMDIPYGRLESFGDLLSVKQVENYMNLVRFNDHVNYALWTKNPDILDEYFNMGYIKPTNLQILYSSPYKNNVDMDIMKKYWFIDKVFTVWDSAEIAHENGYEINCGKRDCFKCHKCYIANDIELIHELLK